MLLLKHRKNYENKDKHTQQNEAVYFSKSGTVLSNKTKQMNNQKMWLMLTALTDTKCTKRNIKQHYLHAYLQSVLSLYKLFYLLLGKLNTYIWC